MRVKVEDVAEMLGTILARIFGLGVDKIYHPTIYTVFQGHTRVLRVANIAPVRGL